MSVQESSAFRCSILDIRFAHYFIASVGVPWFRRRPQRFTKLRLFQHIGNSGFVDLDFYVVGHFHEHGVLFYVGNETVNTGARHHAVAALQAGDQFLLLFLAFFLWPDHHKIHDDENENQRHEKRADAAAGDGRRRPRLSLSENHAQHIENWRAHLKHERARCNRSFASLVLSKLPNWPNSCSTAEGIQISGSLEVRGFEPLAFSLRTRRSTS